MTSDSLAAQADDASTPGPVDAQNGDASEAIPDAGPDAAPIVDASEEPDAIAPDAAIGAIDDVELSCEPASGDDACAMCQKAQCCTTLAACTGECAELVVCSANCMGDTACNNGCLPQHPAGLPPLLTIYNCVRSNCATPCAGQI